MPSPGILRCENVVRTDVSEEHIFIINVKRTSELGTLALSNLYPILSLPFSYS
jgi:hypothetical protein